MTALRQITKVRNIGVEHTRSSAQQVSISYWMPPTSNLHHEIKVLTQGQAAEELQHCILDKRSSSNTVLSTLNEHIDYGVTSMVCLDDHSCSAADHQSQEYRSGAMQGAELYKQAIHLGCHLSRTIHHESKVLG